MYVCVYMCVYVCVCALAICKVNFRHCRGPSQAKLPKLLAAGEATPAGYPSLMENLRSTI